MDIIFFYWDPSEATASAWCMLVKSAESSYFSVLCRECSLCTFTALSGLPMEDTYLVNTGVLHILLIKKSGSFIIAILVHMRFHSFFIRMSLLFWWQINIGGCRGVML